VILGKKRFQERVKESIHKNTAVIPSAAMGKPTFYHFHPSLFYVNFLAAIFNSLYQMRYRDYHKWWVGTDLKGGGHGPCQSTILVFNCKQQGN
jgi:hypothetical protein